MSRKKKIQDESLPQCEICGDHDETVSEKMDPFAYEIHNEEVYCNMCDECEYQKRMDI